MPIHTYILVCLKVITLIYIKFSRSLLKINQHKIAMCTTYLYRSIEPCLRDFPIHFVYKETLFSLCIINRFLKSWYKNLYYYTWWSNGGIPNKLKNKLNYKKWFLFYNAHAFYPTPPKNVDYKYVNYSIVTYQSQIIIIDHNSKIWDFCTYDWIDSLMAIRV